MTNEIILIYPKTGFDVKKVSIEVPLSVLSAASILDKEGYKVKIIDQRIEEKNWQKKLTQELKDSPICVGISSMTGTQIYFGIDAAKIIRKNNPETKIVWGGIHPTLLPKQTLESNYVDIVVKGEGEKTFFELVQNLEKGKSLREINGVAYKDDGKIIENPNVHDFLNLDKLPELPYHLLDIKNYIKMMNGVFSFQGSRGCPFKCAFCCNPLLSKGFWRTMSAERIMQEIQMVHNKYKFKKLKFNDENFFVNKERVYKIADAINDAYEWEAQARIDTIDYMDYDRLRKSGLYQIQPGIESGNQRILNLIRKQLTTEQILNYNRKLAKTGIIATYNFIMGFPSETIEEIKDSVKFVLKLLDENPYSELAAFYVFVPYPGTELFDLSLKYGFIPPNSLAGWGEFSRQHLETPWIQDKKELLQNLEITSKFVDSRRIARLFKGTFLPRVIPKILGNIYRKKWQKENFKMSFDLRILKFFIEKKVKISS
ncbi:MAG: B12-binding domain-containing radical SAM protein [Nanoarchaeota archaeon]|nr:B12-binding domain-containing radical SAM protein [Nanoarchaeota archaeon]